MLKNGLLLGLFALLCTGLVAIVNQFTYDKIKQQEQQELARVLHQIIPDEIHDNQLTSHCIGLTSAEFLGTEDTLPAYIATMNGKGVAIAIEAIAPDGYNGNIKVIIDKDATFIKNFPWLGTLPYNLHSIPVYHRPNYCRRILSYRQQSQYLSQSESPFSVSPGIKNASMSRGRPCVVFLFVIPFSHHVVCHFYKPNK